MMLLSVLWCSGQEGTHVIGEKLPAPLPIIGKKIAVIYDDGPVPGSTEVILDSLKKNDMRATFSVVGKNVAANPELTKRIVAEGHELANQLWSHPDLSKVTEEQVLAELRQAEEVIFSVTGVHARYFRPPDGYVPPDMEDAIKSAGYLILIPTFDSGDWRNPPPGLVTKAILDGVTPGAIILAHDSFPKSVAEMPGILDELSQRGYKSLTISQLLMEIVAQK